MNRLGILWKVRLAFHFTICLLKTLTNCMRRILSREVFFSLRLFSYCANSLCLSGRAGRNGDPAISIIYYSKEDREKKIFSINQEYERPETKLESKRNRNNAIASFNKMAEYCSTQCCRRKMILQYFDELPEFPETGCSNCDFCTNPKKVEQEMQQGSNQMPIVQPGKRKLAEYVNQGRNIVHSNADIDEGDQEVHSNARKHPRKCSVTEESDYFSSFNDEDFDWDEFNF